MAVAPAGDVGVRVALAVQQAGNEVALFDREARATLFGVPRAYALLDDFAPELILVAASRYGGAVLDECSRRRMTNTEVVEFCPPEVRWVTLEQQVSQLCDAVVSGDDVLEFERWRAGRQVVVVLAHSHFADLTERKLALAKAGFAVLQLEALPLTPFDLERGFVRLDAYAALRAAGAGENDLLYAVLNLLGHAALAVIRRAIPDLRVVAYAYDWLHMVCPPESRHIRSKLLPIALSQLDMEFELEAVTGRGEHSDLLLVKDDARKIPGLTAEREAFREFRAIPVADHVTLPQLGELGCPLRFVYIGSIVSPRDHSREFFGDTFLAPVVRRVIAQGFQVSMWYGRGEHAAAADLRVELGESPLLSISPGGPVTSLIEHRLVEGDIGWMLSDSEFEHQLPHARGSLPSKIFAYAAAGLAVAVSDRCHAVAELVTREGIGFVVPRERIDDLTSLLAMHDIRAMKHRARAFFRRMVAIHGTSAFVEAVAMIARREGSATET